MEWVLKQTTNKFEYTAMIGTHTLRLIGWGGLDWNVELDYELIADIKNGELNDAKRIACLEAWKAFGEQIDRLRGYQRRLAGEI